MLQNFVGSLPRLNRFRTVFLHTPRTGSNPLTAQTSSVNVPSPLGTECAVAGVGAAVGEGLGEGVGVGEGFDDFCSFSPVFSCCLAIVFVSACEADFFSAFFESTFSAGFFSLFLFAASLSFGEVAPREPPEVLPGVLPDVAPDVLPDVLPDVVVDVTGTIFSPGFRSSTLRGLVATCGGGGGFAVAAEGLGPVALTVLNATGLSGVGVPGAPGWVGPCNRL